MTQLRKKDKILTQQQYNGLNPYYIDNEGKLHSGVNEKEAEKLKYEKYKLNTSFYDRPDDVDRKPLKDRLFFYDTDEDDEKENFNLAIKYANYETFTKYLDETFKKYEINKCIQKIHFLAQIYVETNRFRTTIEHEPRSYYSGGEFYGGRGIKQITHDYNYLAYYDVTEGQGKGKNLYALYNNKRLSNFDKRKGKIFVESVVDFNIRTTNEFISIEEMNKFNEFVKIISISIYYACDSAGWYWDKNKLNDFANDDENAIIKVSAKVNNPNASKNPSGKGINELDNRKLYFEYLKEISDYENCK